MDTQGNYATLEGVELIPVYGGFHVRSLGQDRCIHIMQMLVNWRLGLWYGPCGRASSRPGPYWCFPRRDKEAFLKVVGEALAWDGTPENPPEGWIKSYTGEYRGDLRV